MATKTRELADFLIEGSSDLPLGKPHITPGVLYPAVIGKLLDGSTSHSGNYGTAQSDGHSYYYTDIKGSKPIKDPRIGGHFGSQRHKIKSMQLLEQETATHGTNVYSIDGREWFRIATSSHILFNDGGGAGYIRVAGGTSNFYELTGYFIDANLIFYNNTSNRGFTTKVDGGSTSSENTTFETTVSTPLAGRYVDAGALGNLGLGLTLGIHTLRISPHGGSDNVELYGIELIAQDTTSTANKSKIQIPSQNVVSYGKKFTVSGTPHYNPFATKGDGSASTIPNNTTGDSVATGWAGSTSAYWDSSLDTATSLGLGAWESGGNFYRPVNGGRVVKWVDSTGTIKTSVNMMPPEAHAIGSTSASLGDSAATGTHNWSTVYQPQFGNKITGSDLITNGTFTSNTTGWTAEGNTSIASTSGGQSGNCLTMTRGTGTSQTVKQTYASFVVGKWYKMSAYIKQGTGTGDIIYLRAEGAGASHYPQGPAITSTGSFVKHSMVFKAETASYDVILRGGIDTNGHTMLIDTLTLHEIEQPEAQAEVAKTFHWREFGNGAANGGSGATYADTSMLSTSTDSIAYVMDDGLTSLSGVNEKADTASGGVYLQHNNDGNPTYHYITFIGTGFGFTGNASATASDEYDKHVDGVQIVDGGIARTSGVLYHETLAQNLPYGTHIVKLARTLVSNYVEQHLEYTIHQPKRPPIPEDAVVIADYMLMADFVPRTANGLQYISKGTRYCAASRDVFYDAPNAWNFYINSADVPTAMYVQNNTNHADNESTIPSFSTNAVKISFDTSGASGVARRQTWKTNGSTIADGNLSFHATESSNHGTYYHPTANATLGNNVYQQIGTAGDSNPVATEGYEFASPIHTSSHYQSFETPYLHELVGGDRNMEQNNLVVTTDGKTWDEVTRDTSYQGPSTMMQVWRNGGNVAQNVKYIWNLTRGISASGRNIWARQKNIAIGNDRIIILEDGTYNVYQMNHMHATGNFVLYVYINDTIAGFAHNSATSSVPHNEININVVLKRGDYLTSKTPTGGAQLHGLGPDENMLVITKLD